MRFKKIMLQNIRSYRNAEIEFPEGSTLLSGDIGSGKSSILLAIEFALFGLQRGKSGESLLRKGEKEGKVKFNFEIDGKKVMIERNLKKSKDSVQQDDCIIDINGEKKEISSSELKTLILQMLNYPAELAQKNPVLYRYTVYTPQEEMKLILQENADNRLNTLRRVFNIDKYKRILENADKLISKLKEEIKIKETAVLLLEPKKTEIESKRKEREKVRAEIIGLKLKLEDITKILNERKSTLLELEAKIKELNSLKTEKASLSSEYNMKRMRIEENKKEIENLKRQINQYEQELKGKSVDELKVVEAELKNKEKTLSDKEAELMKLSGLVMSYELSKKNSEKILNDILNLEKCPTCKQEVSERHKQGIKEKMEIECREIEKTLAEENKRKKSMESEIKTLKGEIDLLRTKDKELSSLKLKLFYLDEKKKQLAKTKENQEIIVKSIVSLNEKMLLIDKSLSEFSETEKNYYLAKRMLDEIKEDEKINEISKAKLERQLEDTNHLIERLEKEISEMENTRKKIIELKRFKDWLDSEFLNTVMEIEKNVMLKLHAEFSSLFGKWFAMLVNELEARVDEEFTPLIEQQGYTIDYDFLSGGERTAAALAYRLALNQVVNSLLSNIKTKNILILDEPTDGFSSEQLDKMREILKELKTEQLILVSHEQKIESFVDNVIRLEKNEGITRIK